jgi:spermidine synthase
MLRLYVIFVVSGFAALLYQVVWQRTLFAIYGINIESVTVIVTAFMLGLGVGSLLGGWLSKDPKKPALLLFSLIEASIGLYGFLSLGLFRLVGSVTLGVPALVTFVIAFALVLLPTVLMGATLPLLVAHSVRRSGNVGRSVGVLYFVNTLGSAAAAGVAVFLLLGNLGQKGTVMLAGCLNLTVSGLAFAQHFKELRRPVGVTPPSTSP